MIEFDVIELLLMIGPIPPPPMFSSPSPLLPPRGGGAPTGSGGGGGASNGMGGAKAFQLAPQTVASSSPNMLSVVSHDLSDLQDDDVEESVDDSDSDRDPRPATTSNMTLK